MKLYYVFLLLISTQLLGQDILYLNKQASNFRSCGVTNLYANAFEVTNKEYSNYVNWLRQNASPDAYIAALPDTNAWKNKLSYREKYSTYYFRHPAYQEYPVVCISHDQAVAYCAWLTTAINSTLHDPTIQKIRFRLPSQEEWEIAARGGMNNTANYPWGTNSVHFESGKFKGALRANFMQSSSELLPSIGHSKNAWKYAYITDITSPVEFFEPNNFGLYQVAGNVAEFTTEQGIVKGGSWISPAYAITIEYTDTMKAKYASNVGLRVFAEIERYKIDEKPLLINAALLEKNCVFIPNKDASFFISQFEVSNDMYNAFLKSLNVETHAKYCPNDSLWQSETSVMQYLNYHTQFLDHPVTNISKEAMVAFCNWLTVQYNSDPARKYQQVEIQLPTYEQWHLAASNEYQNCYSWRSCYTKNRSGQFLMNFNPIADFLMIDLNKYRSDKSYQKAHLKDIRTSRSLDGYELTNPVSAFQLKELLDFKFPYELYNLNGNVAEVVTDSDLVLGGSFASFEHECMTYLDENITGLTPLKRGEDIKLPSPQIGFRFIMRVTSSSESVPR